jgi:KaiC/GvpD/RAD55 family RecA-like ATPase
MSYSIDDHPDVQAAKADRDQAEQAARDAAEQVETLIQQAKAKGQAAREAVSQGDEQAADARLKEKADLKEEASRQRSIADARKEMAEEAEHAYRATIDQVKQELREEAKAERGEKLQAAADAYDAFAEKLEAARAIDETYAGLVGSTAAKVVPTLKTQDRRGRTRSMDTMIDKLREKGERDAA